ncbi:gamma-butyrobetaine hydroxylase-like domain-containing protein [Aureimonas frigidaquae]|uniref:Gamma-butyrobetaine hydroxylase-like N-terminal domain-containing protein n=1 Tax=Aureimonas frigidaquae TaxID=424757 RepID=A0A0P0Z2P5_9HYPH|nr:DUF971 domain-containing protein [Aureimonas frigidaquae]BAT28286.1 hypothetical protein [Aureimonas frigidaquae]
MSQTVPPPKGIVVSRDRRSLKLIDAEGRENTFAAELLRVSSPSAEVQGHSPEQRVTVAGKRDVTIRDVLPVGHYAIRIVFDDGHDTGLFTWSYFHDLAGRQEAVWNAYLEALAAKGLSR